MGTAQAIQKSQFFLPSTARHICIRLHLKVFLYLKAQHSSWSTERVLCFRDQVFPLLFPIHTSKPASARIKPMLLLGRLEIQLLASPRRPCCSNTTGLDPANKRKFQLVACSMLFSLSLHTRTCVPEKSMCNFDFLSQLFNVFVF